MDGWVQRASPAVADIDNDGKQEIFIGTNTGYVYGFREDKSALAGWPVNVIGSVASAPAVGDITGDGVPEVVVTAGGLVTGGNNTGGIWAFSASGQLLWRKVTMVTSATKLPGGVFASPVLVDLDENGILDVVTASYDQNVYALKGDGTSVFPNALPAAAGTRNGALIWLGDGTWATPAVGDVDGDGSVDIVVTSTTNVDARLSYVYGAGWDNLATVRACTKAAIDPNNIDYDAARAQKRACGLVAVFSSDGQLKPGWPKFIAGHSYDASPAIADLDGDGKLEIVTGNGFDPNKGDNTQPYSVTIWNYNGTVRQRYNIDAVVFTAAPALGDIDGDGKIDIVVGTTSNLERANARKIFAFDDQLQVKPGFPVAWSGAVNTVAIAPGTIALADINQDGKADIIAAANSDIRALSGTGQFLDTALTLHGTSNFTGTPAIADIDADGSLELVYGSGVANSNPGRLYRYDLSVAASAQALPWAQFHGNVKHTGLLTKPDVLVIPGLNILVTGATTKSFGLRIDDTLGGNLSWSATVTDGATWITLDKTSGKTPDRLGVTVDSGGAGLSAVLGTATGTIQVTAGGITKSITVKLTKVDQLFEVSLPKLS